MIRSTGETLRLGVLALSLPTLVACGAGARTGAASEPTPAALPAIGLDEVGEFPLEKHVESADIAAGEWDFPRLFEAGALLFHAPFNGLDGVGIAKRPDGTAVARFGAPGPGGPGAQSCGSCHGFPVPAAAGLAHTNISLDPDRDGKPPWHVRSVISTFGNGLLQLLAQEMTEELHAIRDDAAAAAKAAPGMAVRRELQAKGIGFGAIAATAGAGDEVTFDVSGVEGVDPDLVVRPFGWKGDSPTVRNFVAGPAMGGLGMQPEELLWKNPDTAEVADPDGDGVARELTVGDITAMTVYNAAQETPFDVERLAAMGHVAAPSAADVERLATGRAAFDRIGCARCHTPELKLQSTVFEEPTKRGGGGYFDGTLAARDPGYDPERPFRFDLLTEADEPRVEAHPDGGAVLRLYGDLKRHAMGRVLAEAAGPSESGRADFDPVLHDGEKVMIPADHFLTAELWGVGNTGPWLHDGRAGTLREAVLLHGEDEPPAVGEPGRSEAQESRDAFVALPEGDQKAVIALLRSLVTFSLEKDRGTAGAL